MKTTKKTVFDLFPGDVVHFVPSYGGGRQRGKVVGARYHQDLLRSDFVLVERDDGIKVVVHSDEIVG